MSVKILKKLQVSALIERSREDFKKELTKSIVPEILKTIEGGNNPIKGGKQPKYSDSYIKQIQGKAAFFRKNGKVIAIEEVSKKDLKSYRASESASKQNQRNKEFLRYTKQQFKDKKVSPVNLKLKGDLHKSAEATVTPNGVLVTFTDPKAEWINEGTKNMPARRLLPNKPGEEFNYNIFKRILDTLKSAIKKNI